MSKPQDKSIALLINQLAEENGQWLIVADENWPQMIWSCIKNSPQRTVIAVTNRIDIAKAAKLVNIDCHFNDFDFSELGCASFDGVIYRVSRSVQRVTILLIQQPSC